MSEIAADGSGSGPSFSARSVALSLLLGTHPPRLPTSVLVRTGELFGIAPGSMRTALSRMAAKGEVAATDSGYELAGSQVERQKLQDAGRRAATPEWDGRWITVTPLQSARSLAERREMRRRLEHAGFGELRPDYWLRPANRSWPGPRDGLVVTIGDLVVEDLASLVADLWPLERLQTAASDHLTALDRLSERRVRWTDDQIQQGRWLADAFTVSAGIVRFLMREPRLPPTLVPAPWCADRLRGAYNDFEATFQTELGRFLRRQSGGSE